MARIQELTMPRGNRALLILALAAGLVAAILVFFALGEDDEGGLVSSSGGAVKVVVATADIPAGAEITGAMVNVIEVPAALAVKNAFTDAAPVVGQKARVPISQGEQVASSKVGAQTADDGLAYVVPKGKRALAIKVEEVTAVGGLLLPGDRVDVLAAFPGEEDEATLVVTVLQDVEVLAVAQEAQEPVPAAQTAPDGSAAGLSTSGRLPEDADTNPDAGTVTVAVDPQQAQILVGAQEEAEKVWLTLRPFGEGPPGEVGRVNISSIIGR